MMLYRRQKNKILTGLALLLFVIASSATSQGSQAVNRYETIFRIPLRIHLGNSNRPPSKWLPILKEINSIWFTQAAICFTIHTVSHDEENENGFDLWFESSIPEWNGYYANDKDMHVRDTPDLRAAENPAHSPAARTAAHELGHALGLIHRQDSDDNLMRSKTYGWQLNNEEILQARNAARLTVGVIASTQTCDLPVIHVNP